MKELKLALKQWNSEVFGNINTKLKQAEDELHQIDLVEKVRELVEAEKARRREVSEEAEIRCAITDCDGNKALGPDGFNLACVQKMWKVMKSDVINFISEFHKNSKLVKGINSSFITLVPKKENLVSVANYRLITLVGSLYKILSKVLSSRLKAVLPQIISKNQSAFLGGMNILDGVLVTNEVVDGWKKSRKRGLIIKLDFEKIYDLLNWDFLFSMMINFGFGEKWMGWIKERITSSRLFVLVNGVPTGEFSPQRGLRQGDSLSPFLFNIVAEGLNILLSRALDMELIKGVKIGAGLKINYHKSVVSGVGVPVESMNEFASVLNCKVKILPIKYLGLPLGAKPSRKTTWRPILDKVTVKLVGWKKEITLICREIDPDKLKVGNGHRVKFWVDKWCENISLKDDFPLLYRLVVNKGESFSAMMERKVVTGDWLFQFRKERYDWESVEVTRLIGFLEVCPVLWSLLEDTLVWEASKTRRFTVESVYKFLEGGFGRYSRTSKRVWVKYIPPRVQFFGWLAWKGRLKTADFLLRIGVLNANASTLYIMCKSVDESINHVLLSCPVTWRVWSKILNWGGVQGALPDTVEAILHW
ncbi:uncharacterized protein LOC114312615 [Camellia sinensis]|uniref:uncharacterized protein LOC114312615 n=1 Tax=Camellia sinensis TaxID=4442 RepID=UPI0010357CD5|nr:uncharacterized protein LOC114312615 [Camellia sinensis]